MNIREKNKQRISLLHPKLVKEVLEIENFINTEVLKGEYRMLITHTLRTFKEQDELYNQGRSYPGNIVTYSKGGYSYHNYGLAIDFCLSTSNGSKISYETLKDYDKDSINDWKEVVNVFKGKGYKWGGDFKNPDRPHFEKSLGYSVESLLKNYNKTGKIYI